MVTMFTIILYLFCFIGLIIGFLGMVGTGYLALRDLLKSIRNGR